jgi:dolichyl-phosphate-mannose--protein O-mannosyl transferase
MAGMPAAVATPFARPAEDVVDRVRQRLVRPLPDDGWWGWLLPLAVAGVAAAMRFWRLGRPGSVVVDETYYHHDAWNLLKHGVELDSNSHDQTPGFVVHPPLGKWLIAVGQAMFGNNPWGWRFSAAVIGSLSVLMIARIARRMFRSTALGVVAGLLLTFDALEFVQSRVAMLDIFLMFWVLAAFGCLVVDRDDGRRRMAAAVRAPLGRRDRGPWLGLRPWRWGCGLCLGAAAATKWDGVFWLPLFLVLAVAWDAGARRVVGARQPVRSALMYDGAFALVPFLVVPVVVYVASWTGWFVSDAGHAFDHDRYVHGQGTLGHAWAVFRGWLDYHRQIYHFHATLTSSHPYLSRPYGWLLLARPVAYFYASPHGCGAATCSQEVLGIGTPLIWWLSIPALVAAGWRWVAARDWRGGLILLAFLVGYLPWFREDAHHRTMFLFYMMPAVPFMVLALTMAVGLVIGRVTATERRRVVGGVVAGAYLVAVIWNFAYLYPVLSGQVITYQQWHDRMWFQTCSTAKHRNEHVENAPCWI